MEGVNPPNFQVYFPHGMRGLRGKVQFRGLDKILAKLGFWRFTLGIDPDEIRRPDRFAVERRLSECPHS
jgi:hypothetical protein